MLASLQFGVKNFSLAAMVLKMDRKIQNAYLVDCRVVQQERNFKPKPCSHIIKY